jgi:hypothetical protein
MVSHYWKTHDRPNVIISCSRPLKAKAVPLHTTEALEGTRYSSYSLSTSALDGGEWSVSRGGRALAPGKVPPVPTVQEAGWASEPVWAQRPEEKSFRPCRGSNLDHPDAQPVARYYADWATRLTATVGFTSLFYN